MFPMRLSLDYRWYTSSQQATVNHLAGGSNPSRGANFWIIACWRGSDFVKRLTRTSIAWLTFRLFYPRLQAQDRLKLLIQFVFSWVATGYLSQAIDANCVNQSKRLTKSTKKRSRASSSNRWKFSPQSEDQINLRWVPDPPPRLSLRELW